ncbi:MAG: flagellar protein FlaG [Pseudomonadota bacterium]
MDTIKPLPSALASPLLAPAAATVSQPGREVTTSGAPQSVAFAEKVAPPVDPAALKYSVEAINKFLKVNSEVQFSIDDASGKSVIKVVDTESKEILRQFPSEQALEIGKDLGKLKGFLINSQA